MHHSSELPRLIDLPTPEACQIKWERGAREHGPIFKGDPLEELDYELLDAVNYHDEAVRQGIPMDGIRAELCGLRDRLRAIYAQRGPVPHS